METLLSFLLALAMVFTFAEVTSAAVNGGGYTSIPEAVRDFYSKEVFFQAQPRLHFLRFAKVKRDLQAARGKAMVFTRYQNLAGGGKLLESDVLVPKGMSTSEVSIPVFEQGNSIQVTEFLLRTSMLDVLGDASKILANNVAVTLDTQFRDVVLSATQVVYGNGKATAATVTATDVFNTKTVKDAVEILANNNAPKFTFEEGSQGDFYVCFLTPHQARTMRDDPNWISANTYMGRRQLYVGEIGMYEGVVFIETTQMPTLTNAQAVSKYGTFTPTNGYEAVMFGENAFAWAVALDVELRDDGVTELGRKHTIGWYGIWGMGLLEPQNVVRILTA